jgi:hypothetical protein
LDLVGYHKWNVPVVHLVVGMSFKFWNIAHFYPCQIWPRPRSLNLEFENWNYWGVPWKSLGLFFIQITFLYWDGQISCHRKIWMAKQGIYFWLVFHLDALTTCNKGKIVSRLLLLGPWFGGTKNRKWPLLF